MGNTGRLLDQKELAMILYDAIWLASDVKAAEKIDEFLINIQNVGGYNRLTFLSVFENEPKIVYDFADKIMYNISFTQKIYREPFLRELMQLRAKL